MPMIRWDWPLAWAEVGTCSWGHIVQNWLGLQKPQAGLLPALHQHTPLCCTPFPAFPPSQVLSINGTP